MPSLPIEHGQPAVTPRRTRAAAHPASSLALATLLTCLVGCHEVNGGRPSAPTAATPATPTAESTAPQPQQLAAATPSAAAKVPPTEPALEGSSAAPPEQALAPDAKSPQAPAGPGTGASTDDEAPTAPRNQPKDCVAAIRTAAQQAIAANNACSTDADCAHVDLSCQRGCGAYVRADRIEAVKRVVRDASGPTPCRCPPPRTRCATPVPACIAGQCGYGR